MNLKSHYALIIPESRTRPHTKGRLYNKVLAFLEAKDLADFFDLYIVTIRCGLERPDAGDKNRQLQMDNVLYTPKSFRSRGSIIPKEELAEMVKEQTKHLKILALKYDQVIVYARGSYLKSLQIAAKKAGVEVAEVLGEYELSQLKRRGIVWMKVGLRMHEAFGVFQKKVLSIVYYASYQGDLFV